MITEKDFAKVLSRLFQLTVAHDKNLVSQSKYIKTVKPIIKRLNEMFVKDGVVLLTKTESDTINADIGRLLKRLEAKND